MDSIIDAHGHLGDILHPGGGRLIDETGVTKEPVLDLADGAEKRLHRSPAWAARISFRLIGRWITRGQSGRSAESGAAARTPRRFSRAPGSALRRARNWRTPSWLVPPRVVRIHQPPGGTLRRPLPVQSASG